jgi:HSP20 family protein
VSLLNPLRPFDESGTRSGSMVEDFFRDLWAPSALASRARSDWARFNPRVNVTERGDAYELECELPGVKPEEVKVNLTGDTLTIEGEKSCEDRRDGDTWHVSECAYGSFLRTFSFPAVIEGEAVEATHEHGVLKVRVPKAKASQPRRIEVRPGRKGQEGSTREIPVSEGEQQQGQRQRTPAHAGKR